MNDLLEIPKCPEHNLRYEYVFPRTYEQKCVGAMYKCPVCNRSTLFMSKELREKYEKARKNKLRDKEVIK